MAPAPAPTEVAAAPAPAPSFDVIRVAPDGSAVVAGQVAPGAKVSLLVDGIEIAAPAPDASGKFVALFTLPAAGAGRLMTMIVTQPDGTMAEAGAAVALAATTAPAATVATDSTGTAPDATAAASGATSGTATADATAPAAAQPEAAPAQTGTQTGTDTGTQTGTTALVVTDQGAKLVQSGTPVPAEVAANVSLEVISYPDPATVQFAGHGTADAFVRLYLDNASLGEAVAIGKDGAWSVTETGIAPKIYTLRVDQVDAAGKVTSRFETPFKRETPEALAAAAKAASSSPAPVATPAADASATPQAAPDAPAATTSLTDGSAASAPAVATATTAPGTEPAPATAPDQAASVAAPASESPPAAPAPVSVTVQPGYTLWGIARKQMGSGFLYVQVWQANKDKIRNPDLIYPGQVFTLPKN